MGNSSGKDKISKEDMQFLQEKTQLDKDSIQVCFPSPVILSSGVLRFEQFYC